MIETRRYKAFISYSHRDEAFVRWLHRRLEAWAIPRDLIGRETRFGAVPSRLRPIFRDRDDFSGGSSLKAATMAALADSDALLVVCSPHSASSPHVDTEIRQFKLLGRAARVIPIIIDGEPGHGERNCFPPALLVDPDPADPERDIPVEPIAADARDQGDGRQRAAAKLVAGLLDLPFDEIVKREERGRRARVAGWSGAAAGAFLFATALSSLALYNAYQMSLTVEKGVYAIGGLIRDTYASSLAEAERDASLSTQCDLMDSLAGTDRDLAGPEEQAVCFLRRTLAGADLLGPDKTTRTLCAWRDSLLERLGPKPKSADTFAAALALSETFRHLTQAPGTLSACGPGMATDIDAHADIVFDKLTMLARLRPDLDRLRLSHEDSAWDSIDRHERREDWEASRKIMTSAAETRAAQAKASPGTEAVSPTLINQAIYLRRLAWLHYTHLSDKPEAIRLAQESLAIWDKVSALQPSDIANVANQAVIAHLVFCEALAFDGQRERAIAACQQGLAQVSAFLDAPSSLADDVRSAVERTAEEIRSTLAILRQPQE